MNNFLDLTPGSTAATDRAVLLYMPPDEAKQVLAYFDRCQAAEAEVQRLTPDDAHARQCRTAAIEALVLRALDNATLRSDLANASWCKRTKKVRDHMLGRDEYPKVPTLVSIRKVLMKYGYVKSFIRSNQNDK